MISLDTTKLLLPLDSIKEIRLDNFKPIETLQGNSKTLIKDTIYVSNPAIGFNHFELNNRTNEVFITVSGKLLGEYYYQGITKNTIGRLVRNINQVGICKVGLDEILKAKTLRTDPVNNIEVKDIKKALDAIMLLASANTDYNIQREEHGYTAIRKVKSYKERQIGYSKLKEMESRKTKFNLENVNQFSENTLRIEQNLSSFARMRKAFKIPNNKLESILYSKANPNYDLFKKIVSKGLQSKIDVTAYSTLSFKELEKMKAAEAILEDFQWDLSKVNDWLKRRYPRTKTSNPASRYKKQFTDQYNLLMAKNENYDVSPITEIDDKLSRA